MLRRSRQAEPGLTSLRELLRGSVSTVSTVPTGWLLLPHGDDWNLETQASMRDLDSEDLYERDDDVVAIGGQEFVPTVDGHTLHGICQGASQLEPRPSDETLLAAFRYYMRFDAFLPAIGAPDPPPFEEITYGLDREFLDMLSDERSDKPCRKEGCSRGSVQMSVLCRIHHFESVKNKPCPFTD